MRIVKSLHSPPGDSFAACSKNGQIITKRMVQALHSSVCCMVTSVYAHGLVPPASLGVSLQPTHTLCGLHQTPHHAAYYLHVKLIAAQRTEKVPCRWVLLQCQASLSTASTTAFLRTDSCCRSSSRWTSVLPWVGGSLRSQWLPSWTPSCVTHWQTWSCGQTGGSSVQWDQPGTLIVMLGKQL